MHDMLMRLVPNLIIQFHASRHQPPLTCYYYRFFGRRTHTCVLRNLPSFLPIPSTRPSFSTRHFRRPEQIIGNREMIRERDWYLGDDKFFDTFLFVANDYLLSLRKFVNWNLLVWEIMVWQMFVYFVILRLVSLLKFILLICKKI